ncbi:hypothetical protein B0H13DRAFT_2462049 [Mycena leptocephala]|nr:hypothetical protein B0H13DRAFT_2462049 [Mycena leptocephala]
MSSSQKAFGPTYVHEQPPDPSEEAAASKLWAVYASEAEKYDRSLVESWKSDMEGMLILASGSFSASLTAFIIESYKTLIPDSGDSTVRLLAQISEPLAAASNGSNFKISAPAYFYPSASSLACNALWFISLGLSLTCALIATLFEQWAREFFHKADMRSAPVIRARIFSYLYYGLKRFNMHTVVDIIPLLLHASLVLFFAGLVAFLFPINVPIAAVADALLAAVIAVYLLFTVLPMWSLDCPYRTLLSIACWRTVDNGPDTSDSSSTETMVEAMSHRAMEESPARAARDYRALVWTVKSLADDIELEPFVEGIPMYWGPLYRRYMHQGHIEKLMRDPDLQLLPRIAGLLCSCRTGLLSEKGSRRRRITSYKTLWAVASIQTLPESPSDLLPLDFSQLLDHHLEEKETSHYSTSAVALMKWSTFCSVKDRIVALQVAERLEADVHRGCNPSLQPIKYFIDTFPLGLWHLGTIWAQFVQYFYQSMESVDLSVVVADFVEAVEAFCSNTPHKILFDYLVSSAALETPPYRFTETQAKILLEFLAPSSALEHDLEQALEDVVYSISADL